VSVYVPTDRTIESAPGLAFASMTAARSVVRPAASWAKPSPGLAPGVSRKELTTKVAGRTRPSRRETRGQTAKPRLRPRLRDDLDGDRPDESMSEPSRTGSADKEAAGVTYGGIDIKRFSVSAVGGIVKQDGRNVPPNSPEPPLP